MKVKTPEIVWHNKEPVFTVDFHRNGPIWRMATGGADNDVKVWKVDNAQGGVIIHFLASLSRHTKAVNVVRFSPCGTYLASAGDDHVVLLWTLEAENAGVLGNLVMDDANKESWSAGKVLRGHLEDVYDLCWSKDSNYIITGSVDNSAIVWDVQKGHQIHILKESKQYVQGVCWDPLGKVVACLSSDRTLRVYSAENRFKCLHSVTKLSAQSQDGDSKSCRMWIDEGLNSFFRRLTFTPDGSFLIVPAGRYEAADNKSKNATYIFSRSNWTRPVLQLPCPEKPTVVVKCCPIPFQLREESDASLTSLPYRMVYAVASLDSILLYDTQHSAPFGYISNIHYSGITDVAWSNDGSLLVVSSSDCYCSFITFEENELGIPLDTAVMFPNKTNGDSAPGSGTPRPPQRLSSAEAENCSSPSSVQATPSRASSNASSGCGLAGSKLKSPRASSQGAVNDQGRAPRRIRPTMISSSTTAVSAPAPPITPGVPMDIDVDSSSNTDSPSHGTKNDGVKKCSLLPENPSNSTDVTSSRSQPRRVDFITLSSFKKPNPPPPDPSLPSSSNS